MIRSSKYLPLIVIRCTISIFTVLNAYTTCETNLDCIDDVVDPYCCKVNNTYKICGNCHGSCDIPDDCTENDSCCYNQGIRYGNCYPKPTCPTHVPPEPPYVPDATTVSPTTTTNKPKTTTTPNPSSQCSPLCVDSNPCCTYFAQNGLCKTELEHMAVYCPAACGFCVAEYASRTKLSSIEI